jgi:hypothetical protein
MVKGLIQQANITHLLDYGCGHNVSLMKGLKECGGLPKGFRYQCYDPGVPEYADDPVPAELVCCIDVLEHIEPENLDDVLDHLEELTEVMIFGTVHTEPAVKTLPDGRNAHLIQQPKEWWLPKLMERFELQGMQGREMGFEFIAFNKDL